MEMSLATVPDVSRILLYQTLDAQSTSTTIIKTLIGAGLFLPLWE